MIRSDNAKGYRREKGNDALGLKPAFAVFLMVACLWGPCTVFSEVFLTGRSQLSPFMQSKAPVASIVVKNTYPHDTEAFTQGLLFHQGFFYESTGLLGKSTLARKDMKTGKVLQEVKLPREFFGEGIVLLKDKIYQLTWQNEAVLIYDARRCSGGIRRHLADNRNEIGNAIQVNHHENNNSQKKVKDRAGQHDEQTLPGRLPVKRSFFILRRQFFRSGFSQQFDKSAQRNPGKDIFRFPDFFPDDFRPESQREFRNPHIPCARSQKMAQFMDKNQNTQQNDE
jgi:hypothetical protein